MVDSTRRLATPRSHKSGRMDKGPKKPTPYAAQTATRNAIFMLVKQGMKEAAIKINGAGPGRAAALKSVVHSGVKLSFIRDVTPLPHNGCRPPKRRRV